MDNVLNDVQDNVTVTTFVRLARMVTRKPLKRLGRLLSLKLLNPPLGLLPGDLLGIYLSIYDRDNPVLIHSVVPEHLIVSHHPACIDQIYLTLT